MSGILALLLGLLATLGAAERAEAPMVPSAPQRPAASVYVGPAASPDPAPKYGPTGSTYGPPTYGPTEWTCIADSAEGEYDEVLVRWLSMAHGEQLRPCNESGPGYGR